MEDEEEELLWLGKDFPKVGQEVETEKKEVVLVEKNTTLKKDDDNNREDDNKSFTNMYGKDASFINATNMMEVAKTMNKKFLQK